MRALVYDAPKEFSVREVPTPEPGPGQALVRVRACGICGTDLHLHEGEFLAAYPLIPGHEIAGEVAAVGPDVTGLPAGTRVVVDNTELCGHCFYCRRDLPLYCENFVSHGCNTAGGLAEYVLVPAAKVFPIRGLSWDEAIMVEPTACAVHGMDRIALTPGCDVLLLGAGPTGLVLAQLLKRNGAARLVVAAPAGAKLELAGELAADETVAIDRADPAAAFAALGHANPYGFDVVVEATGAAPLLAPALSLVRTGGQLIVYGVYPESATAALSPYEIFRREITVKGSFAQTHCFDRALAYLESGAVRVDRLITQRCALDDFATALAGLSDRATIKSVVLP
ncbi:MAG TPA: zinc-dependent alcohol dehydrogenase family protein [Solirubrobacter sp.]|nr:zinc-dependent alcohol dehydrogenase family protein [Solirubrobacter sp.]